MNNPLKYTDPSGYVAKEAASMGSDEFYEELGDKLGDCESSCTVAVENAETGEVIAYVKITKGNGANKSAPSGAKGESSSSADKSGGSKTSSSGNTGSKTAPTNSTNNSSTNSSNTDSSNTDGTLHIDWHAYYNDEANRAPIDSAMQSLFESAPADTPWNFEEEFEVWVAISHYIDQSSSRKTLQLAIQGLRLLTKNRTGGMGNGIGLYRDVGGHHIHAKAAFKNHANYNRNNGISISQAMMKGLNLDHNAMTLYQRQAFKKLLESGAQNSLKAHTKIAVEALIAGGAPKKWARKLAAISLLNLRAQRVTKPSNLPWYDRAFKAKNKGKN